MLFWIPALAIALLAIFGVFRISREYVEESYSPILIIISLTVGIICSMAVSCTFDGLLSPVVLGTQLATVGMGVLLTILSVAGGVKTNLPGIVMGLLVSVPIVISKLAESTEPIKKSLEEGKSFILDHKEDFYKNFNRWNVIGTVISGSPEQAVIMHWEEHVDLVLDPLNKKLDAMTEVYSNSLS